MAYILHLCIAIFNIIFGDSPLVLYLFTQSPNDGHLGCCQFSAIMIKVTMNIHVQVFVWTCSHFP